MLGFVLDCVANNNCIPAHTGGTGSLIILHGARGGSGSGSKQDPRLTDALVGRSHDLRQPGSVAASSNDVLSTLTELKPLQTYSQQSAPAAYQPLYPGPYDNGAFCHHCLSGPSREGSGWEGVS